MRATRRPAADHGAIGVGYDAALHGAVCICRVPSLNDPVGTAALIALNRTAVLSSSRSRISSRNEKKRKKRRRKYRCMFYHLASTCQKRLALHGTCSH